MDPSVAPNALAGAVVSGNPGLLASSAGSSSGGHNAAAAAKTDNDAMPPLGTSASEREDEKDGDSSDVLPTDSAGVSDGEPGDKSALADGSSLFGEEEDADRMNSKPAIPSSQHLWSAVQRSLTETQVRISFVNTTTHML